jgi:hypothetical protein
VRNLTSCRDTHSRRERLNEGSHAAIAMPGSAKAWGSSARTHCRSGIAA